jgi:hypothetical protein
MYFATILTLGAIVIPALAQIPSMYSVVDQSADFNLVVQSRNTSLDGKLLGACHDGAAHEAVCIVAGPYNYTPNFVSFQFNNTRYICTESNSTGTFTVPCNDEPTDPTLNSGTVTWWLPLWSGASGLDVNVSQAMILGYLPSSNVAQATITFPPYQGSHGTNVAFDKNDLLNIIAYQKDELRPENEYLKIPKHYYRWHICETWNLGYHYWSLAWVLGPHSPQNPTCEKVNVTRVFV